jgi:hypothetical protein
MPGITPICFGGNGPERVKVKNTATINAAATGLGCTYVCLAATRRWPRRWRLAPQDTQSSGVCRQLARLLAPVLTHSPRVVGVCVSDQLSLRKVRIQVHADITHPFLRCVVELKAAIVSFADKGNEANWPSRELPELKVESGALLWDLPHGSILAFTNELCGLQEPGDRVLSLQPESFGFSGPDEADEAGSVDQSSKQHALLEIRQLTHICRL